MNDLDGAADEKIVLGQRERRGLTRRLADDQRRRARLDLAFAQAGKGLGIQPAALIERRGKVGDAAGEPCEAIFANS